MTDGTGDRKRFPAAVNAETSPGRAAYEAHQRAEASQLRSEQARAMSIAGKGWEALASYERESWEAAAMAAIQTAGPVLMAENNDLRAGRDQLREQLRNVTGERDAIATELRERAQSVYSLSLIHI